MLFQQKGVVTIIHTKNKIKVTFGIARRLRILIK